MGKGNIFKISGALSGNTFALVHVLVEWCTQIELCVLIAVVKVAI